jgi:hypothetical protein
VNRFSVFVFIVILSSIAGAAGAELPPEVAERLDNIVALDEDGFVGSYRITISSVIQKPGGKGREESFIEADIARTADGSTRRLLKYLEDGSDVTEKKRKKFENDAGGRPNDEEDDDQDLANPFGDTADRYRFGAPETRGAIVAMKFEPAPGHENDQHIARGTLAWDRESLQPKWIEMEALYPPKPLKALQLRLEIDEVAGELYVSRMVTDGLAKILLLKREFHMEMRFDDIRRGKPPATDDHR